MSQSINTTTNLFTTGYLMEKTPFSIPSVDLIRSILRTRELAEQHRKADRWQLYALLMFSLFDVTSKFADLSHCLDIAQDFAKKSKDKFPKETLDFIGNSLNVFKSTSKEGRHTIATRLAYSRLKMQAATLQLEHKKEYSLANVRAELFHSIPLIQELNFIIVLIKTENYLKATLFLVDLEPLFVGNKLDSRLALPYFELACLGYLGQKQFSKSLESLEKGYALCQKMSKSSFQAIRYITFFEKVIKLFESTEDNENIIIPPFSELIVPGYIFDKIFLDKEFSPDSDSILVEL
ncbi:MAG: hypothetical protein HeimC3_01010 [Candidatus Heimdallarchaeota archaeon LC_3]|nr:MAG: hypothetical protein HeimC3_01010 [Candidatus Heimdallarchaeota archaeon LC_3]